MKLTVKNITRLALIAAAYAALTVALMPISYGPVQMRVSEILMVLPFFIPESSVALAVGCFIANAFGGYGVLDMVFGSLATFLSGVCMGKLGKSGGESFLTKMLALLMPVVFNAVFVGGTLAYATASAGAFAGLFALYALEVGAGELAVMAVLEIPAMIYLPKSRVMKYFKEQNMG